MTEYRVRFIGLSDGETLTAKPGVIRNNKPKALRVLRWMRTPNHDGLASPDAWIEKRDSADAEWVRLP